MEFTAQELEVLRQLLESATFKSDLAEVVVSLKAKLKGKKNEEVPTNS